jgi:Domain of unknown function (DUF6089)
MNTRITTMRRYGTFICAFFTISSVFGQFNEAGLQFGVAVYQGDVARAIEPSEMHRSFGLHLRRNHSARIASALQLNVGVLSANDHVSTSITQRQRNLNFRSEFVELTATLEYHLSKFELLASRNSTPFVSAGVGALYFNPQAVYQGMYYDLQPLGTEGQGLTGNRKKYSRIAAQIPLGFGFKWALSQRILVQAQAIAHFTSTDYLDDVSGRYADIEILRATNRKSAQLAYRTPEVNPEKLNFNPKGLKRGDDSRFDRYTTVQLGVHFLLAEKTELEWNDQYRIYDTPKPTKVKQKRKKIFKKKKKIGGVF